MNEQERLELERLKQLQERLQAELNLLSEQLQSLEQRANRPAPQPPPIRADERFEPAPPATPPLIAPALPRTVAAAPPPRVLPTLPPLMPISKTEAVNPRAESSLEMRLGTFWLVRVGI